MSRSADDSPKRTVGAFAPVFTWGVRSLKITLPDQSQIEVPDGSSTYDIASRIGAGLARQAVGGLLAINGHTEVVDLGRPLPGDCSLRILTASDDDPQSLMLLRHSTAHVMAEAICALFPNTKLAYGPPLEDGFYYDIDLDRSITPDDFEKIESEMRRIIKEDRPFTRYEMPRPDAMGKLESEGNRYKVDNALRAVGETLSFYVTGERGRDFEDLCRGPHIPTTGRIGAFKVRQVSGSHYRGDVNDTPLQRVYGTAFYKKSSLNAYLEQLEQAKARDHRVLGRDLDLYSSNAEVGSGLILWHPNGAKIRMLLENFMRSELLTRGYEPVYTPHIGRLELYRRSGHYPYYEESQFPPLLETDRGKVLLSIDHLLKKAAQTSGSEREKALEAARKLAEPVISTWGAVEGLDTAASPEVMQAAIEEALRCEDGFLMKPMNCPHHIHIYKARPRSYRELPVRLAEFGTVYRYEQSGELAGLTRVRGFTQDDAHLFCTPEQLLDELTATVDLTKFILSSLSLNDYRVRLGLRDKESSKFVGSDEAWEQAEVHIRKVAQESGLSFTEEPGEAAFYGPKIDFVVKDCIGREWQLGTVQVDYNLPERFDLTYVGADNRPHRPIMIHRAPFGSLERFIGILIEHFAGAFPLWLSPVQVVVASVSEKSEAYAAQVARDLTTVGLRTEVDTSSDKIGPKKQRHRDRKIPYILVVGEREAAEGSVNVNTRHGSDPRGTIPLEAFIRDCREEVDRKTVALSESTS